MNINLIVRKIILKSAPNSCKNFFLRFLNNLKDKEGVDLIDQKLEQLDLINIKRIIIFLLPNANIANGGIMSIFSLYKVSREYMDIHKSEVILATYPSIHFAPRFTKFKNDEVVIPFNFLIEKLKNLESLTIHIPEIYVDSFLNDLSSSEKKIIRNSKNSILNILNQNIQAMPENIQVDKLKDVFKEITCTTAHKQYCTSEYRKKYGVPLHHFSAENIFSNYVWRYYAQKEELLIYSPDQHPLKEKIVSKIRDNYPNLKLIEIKNITYTEYLDLCSRAKWSITFGEGLDGYFVEPVYCGGCSFAVYNSNFFTEDFKEIKTIYDNYDTFLKNVVCDMELYNDKDRYLEINKSILDVVHRQYNIEEYINNIKLYYQGDYTFK